MFLEVLKSTLWAQQKFLPGYYIKEPHISHNPGLEIKGIPNFFYYKAGKLLEKHVITTTTKHMHASFALKKLTIFLTCKKQSVKSKYEQLCSCRHLNYDTFTVSFKSIPKHNTHKSTNIH